VFAIVAIITLIFAILYALLIFNFRKGWNKLNIFSTKEITSRKDAKALSEISESDLSFSIIISARNEAPNIKDCLGDIIAQDYLSQNFEIIVVDDFSEDETATVIEQFATENPGFNMHLIKMSDQPVKENNSFKKAAITLAIGESRNPWIITSDADCRRGAKWLATIAAFIEENHAVMVSAPVCLKESDDFFDQAQSLEFMGLVGIGGGSIALKNPNMCNGANLIYKKDAFLEVKGFKGNNEIASGDDEFLMHKMFSKWPDKIFFLKNPEAIVYTKPETDLSSFIQQRKRWVSKSRKYSNKNITAVLSGAWLFHLMLLICLVAGIFDWKYLVVFCIAFGLKLMAEYTFLKKVSDFFNREKLLGILIPAAFLYIFYVLFIGIYGNFGGYKWKGRRVI